MANQNLQHLCCAGQTHNSCCGSDISSLICFLGESVRLDQRKLRQGEFRLDLRCSKTAERFPAAEALGEGAWSYMIPHASLKVRRQVKCDTESLEFQQTRNSFSNLQPLKFTFFSI